MSHFIISFSRVTLFKFARSEIYKNQINFALILPKMKKERKKKFGVPRKEARFCR